MLTKKQFQGKYQQAVILIRQFKLNNDKNNKNLGVTPYIQMLNQIQSQQSYIKNLIKKIQDIQDKLAQNYLDPQTARKIGTIKQQLRIQSQRRDHIYNTVKQQVQNQSQNRKLPSKYDYIHSKINKNNNNNTKHPSQVQLSSQKINYNHNSYVNYNNTNNFYINGQSYNQTKNSSFGDSNTTYQSSSQITEQVQQFDFQLQNKLIRQKNQQLNHVQQKMLNIHNIAIQTSQMVNQQGQNLDLIGGQLVDTHKNAREANKQLFKAQQYQRRSSSKYFWCVIFLIIAAAIISAFLYLSY